MLGRDEMNHDHSAAHQQPGDDRKENIICLIEAAVGRGSEAFRDLGRWSEKRVGGQGDSRWVGAEGGGVEFRAGDRGPARE